MLLRVLGPLEVVGEAGPIALGAAKPRTLLAALSIRRGQAISSDELIDALWGESPPASAAKLLQVYVSQLRRVLPAGLRIATRAPGYALEVTPDEVDATAFERLVDEGRTALRTGNPALGASLLARSLALWRGPAYADIRYEPFAEEEIERLERLRSLALEDRLDADLELGRHAEILGEVRGLLAVDPTNERLAARAMLAAYRTTGAAEALEVFARTEAALRTELGEPAGAELAGLRDRVAAGDPRLAQATAQGPGAPLGGALPVAPNPLIGRQHELAELRDLLQRRDVRLVSLTGAGGSGKSRLGLELARDLAPSFANGAVLIELASLGDATLLEATIARAFGVEVGADARAALHQGLAGREALLVLDNMEHLREAARDVVALLAAAPRLTILVTTRVVLHVSGEHVYPVGPLGHEDAVDLFAARSVARDPSFAVDDAARPIVASICGRLDGLPLPIELAAARLRGLGLRTLDARLASRLSVLQGGPRDLPARQQTLRETLAWSVHLLEPREAAVFARLGVFRDGCGLAAAESVAGADDEVLGTLIDHSLVQASDVNGEPRFRLLETVREYALERLGDDRAATEDRLVAWVARRAMEVDLEVAKQNVMVLLGWLDAELDTLRDALTLAARDPDPTNELAIAAAVWRYWWVAGMLGEGRSIFEGIVERRGIVESRAGVRTARGAASILYALAEIEATEALALRIMAAADRLGDPAERSSTHNLLGVLYTRIDRYEESEAHLSAATRIADDAGLPALASTARVNLAVSYLNQARLDEARDALLPVLAYRLEQGDPEGLGFVNQNLGDIEWNAGNLEVAEAYFTASLEAFRIVGFRPRIAESLYGLASIEAQTGRPEAAARRLGAAAGIMAESDWRVLDDQKAAGAAESAREALGDEAFERLFEAGRSGPFGGG